MDADEKLLFQISKIKLLEVVKKEGVGSGYACDLLLLITTLENLKTDIFRLTFMELATLAFLDGEKFIALSKVIRMAVTYEKGIH